jgi:hypothetical protein
MLEEKENLEKNHHLKMESNINQKADVKVSKHTLQICVSAWKTKFKEWGKLGEKMKILFSASISSVTLSLQNFCRVTKSEGTLNYPIASSKVAQHSWEGRVTSRGSSKSYTLNPPYGVVDVEANQLPTYPPTYRFLLYSSPF